MLQSMGMGAQPARHHHRLVEPGRLSGIAGGAGQVSGLSAWGLNPVNASRAGPTYNPPYVYRVDPL